MDCYVIYLLIYLLTYLLFTCLLALFIISDFPCTFEIGNCGWNDYSGPTLNNISLTWTWDWRSHGGIPEHTYSYYGGTGKSDISELFPLVVYIKVIGKRNDNSTKVNFTVFTNACIKKS